MITVSPVKSKHMHLSFKWCRTETSSTWTFLLCSHPSFSRLRQRSKSRSTAGGSPESVDPLMLVSLSDPKTPRNLDLSTNQGIPCIPPNRQSFLIISTPCPVLGTIARVWAGVAPHWSVAPASVELPTCNARPVEKACSIRQQRGGSMKKC